MVFERSDVGSLPRLFEMCFHGGVDQGRKAWQDVDQVQGHFEGHDGCVWGALQLKTLWTQSKKLSTYLPLQDMRLLEISVAVPGN